MDDRVIGDIYREVKSKWNELRLANADPEILKFLVRLMDMMDGEMDKLNNNSREDEVNE